VILYFTLCVLAQDGSLKIPDTCKMNRIFVGEAITQEQCMRGAEPFITKWLEDNRLNLDDGQYALKFSCEGKEGI